MSLITVKYLSLSSTNVTHTSLYDPSNYSMIRLRFALDDFVFSIALFQGLEYGSKPSQHVACLVSLKY